MMNEAKEKEVNDFDNCAVCFEDFSKGGDEEVA